MVAIQDLGFILEFRWPCLDYYVNVRNIGDAAESVNRKECNAFSFAYDDPDHPHTPFPSLEESYPELNVYRRIMTILGVSEDTIIIRDECKHCDAPIRYYTLTKV